MTFSITPFTCPPSSPILRLSPTPGRTFVTGDIHGSFVLLRRALRELNFDPTRDRLICCGDLVNRGSHSAQVLDFLKQPGIHSVRGNHEQDLLDAYRGLEPDPDLVQLTLDNGAQWLGALSPEQRQPYLAAFRELPLVIEVPTSQGLVVMVHAEVPPGWSMAEFRHGLLLGEPELVRAAMRSRWRIKQRLEMPVPDVWRVFCGHSIRPHGPRWQGNVCFCDTGAYLAPTEPCAAPGPHSLTVIDIEAGPEAFESPWRSAGLTLIQA